MQSASQIRPLSAAPAYLSAMARNGQSGPRKRTAPITPPHQPSTASYNPIITPCLIRHSGAVVNSRPSEGNGQAVGSIHLMLRPAGLFTIELVAMFAVCGSSSGGRACSIPFGNHVSTVLVGDKGWMLAHRTPSPPSDIATDTEPREAILVPFSDAKLMNPQLLGRHPNSTPL